MELVALDMATEVRRRRGLKVPETADLQAGNMSAAQDGRLQEIRPFAVNHGWSVRR
jgi:hypothetical protein